ncbi:uncharacterized protein LOC114362918 isoform X2 [Ostrinia furnacalis]|uniref:uncharacterized protein LOC114362918 isoform X2 n=1 Tax=Ostrinia furnacalis TaxID=93504 RepID=UPI00103A293F|nr:uncharacterized protein LOC114362918 isoform X2 [Ostrinia furnacalis]XP_028174305.1 uncharacterized protein LOC114362918 isoform X2 [Ostrinia furnacalis]
MPLKRRVFIYKKGDVTKAIKEISNGGKVRETCRKYNIPRARVINKLKHKYSWDRKMEPPTILTTQEESTLKSWIIAMANKWFPVNREMILDTVKDIIIEQKLPNPFKDNVPSKKWFASFLKRHPDVFARLVEYRNISESPVTVSALRMWYKNLKDYLITEGVADILEDPERIFGADECSFQTGFTGLVHGPQGLNYDETSNKDKESLTVVGTIAASGSILPPLIVYPSRLPPQVFRLVNGEWCVRQSDKGNLTSKCVFDYISDTLVPKLKVQYIQTHVGSKLLMVNNYSYCRKHTSKIREKWQCTKKMSKECQAYVILDLVNSGMTLNGQHNHEPTQYHRNSQGLYIKIG